MFESSDSDSDSIDYDARNPWRRRSNSPSDAHYGKIVDHDKIYFAPKRKFTDVDFDIFTKNAVLEVSRSVVGLVSSSDAEEVFWASGVIFESSWQNGYFSSLVLTSASLLTRLDDSSDIKSKDDKYCKIDGLIDMYVASGESYVGTFVTFDVHYNIAILEFKTDIQLPSAVLRPLDLSFDDLPLMKSARCTYNSESCLRLVPGDEVIAVGRYTEDPYEIMVATGKYCSNESGKIEFLRASCKITKCGTGGPLISREGEVIGINLYSKHHTPFLPINIFSLWWSRFNATRSSRRPWMGMEVANIHYEPEGQLFKQVSELGISQGVHIEKVLPGSPAEISDLRKGDIIIKCHGIHVKSTLQLFELMWNMDGEVVETVVVRKEGGSFQTVNIKVAVSQLE